MLAAIGEDPLREGLADTPSRVARMYEDIFFGVGVNYVSCSPFRVPVARLAAAQAVLSSFN